MKKGLICTFICFFILLFAIPVIHASAPTDQLLLKQGTSGNDVYRLQQKLQEYGYYNGGLDGNFGPATQLAVVNFQIDAGLDPDGIVGATTLEALRIFQPGRISVSRSYAEARKAQPLVTFTKQFLGVPYVWGGQSPAGFDCSGFIYYVFNHFGIQLPRMADAQHGVGMPVSIQDLAPGDLVFFSTYEPGPSHVGIYIGSGQFIHASSGADEVTITPLSKPFYRERYLGARRVLR